MINKRHNVRGLQDLRRTSYTRRSFCVCVLAGVSATSFPSWLNAKSEGWLCNTNIPADLPLLQSQASGSTLPSLEEDPPPRISELSEQGVAYSRYRWRSSDGLPANGGIIRLGVAFVNNPSKEWRERVQARAMRWLNDPRLASRIQFDFSVPVQQAQIRISQTGIGGNGPYAVPSNKSLVGRLALSSRLEDSASTMYIYNIESTEHEFGHALCLGHEHQHEAFPSVIDLEKAVQYYEKNQGWSRKDTIRNVIERRPSCLGDVSFNPLSVMLYPLPQEIFAKGGVQYFNTNQIHERDRRCLHAIYGAA